MLRVKIKDLPNFFADDLVFVALHEDELIWGNDTVEKYRMGGKNEFKILFVVELAGYSVEIMERLFRAMWRSGVVRTGVILKDESTAKVYTYVPFRLDGVCEDTRPVYLGDCFTAHKTVFDVTHKVLNLKKCPIRLSFADDNPWIRKNPVSGRIGYMLKELASRLNFSIVTITPLKGRNGGVCGAMEYTGSKGDVVHGKADIAVGLFNRRECGTLNYIGLPPMNVLTWCAPFLHRRKYIFVLLLKVLKPEVWLAIITSVVLVTFIFLALRFVHSKRIPTMDAIFLAAMLFSAVPMKFRHRSERGFIAVWLFSCLVVRTAYDGELNGKSAVPPGTHVIKDLEDLAEMDLKLCTTIGNRQALEGMDDPHMQLLTDRTKICEGGLFENLASAALHQDGAVLTSDLRCAVTAAEISNKGPPLLYPLAGGRIKLFQFVPMVTVPGFPLNEILSTTLRRSYESGLGNIWIDSTKSSTRRVRRRLRPLGIRNVLPPLFLLVVGYFVGFFILFLEHTHFRWLTIKVKTSEFLKKLFGERLAKSEGKHRDNLSRVE